MAIYHCSVQIIGRNAGRSAVAAAAYRAGEDIINEYDGIEHDFTRKKWIEFTEIILPENAPAEYTDRAVLWNAVELSEKAKDARLCREFELALPVEMSRKQQIKIVEQFVREQLVSQGMCADIAIHAPPVTNDRHQPIDKYGNVTHDINEMQFINPHAHILTTVRPMDKNGSWEKKAEIEYLCKRGDEEKGFTAAEFKSAKEGGWEKQYKFADGKKKIWLTARQGQELGLERVNRSPKTSRYGRSNEKLEYWNSKDRIYEWRKSWEQIVNEEFIHMQSDIRIDCRSFKDQGREDEIPTLHMGPSATNMERRAERELREGKSETEILRSDIGNINREIREHNRFVRALRAKIDVMIKNTRELTLKIAKTLEGLRAKIIGNKYEQSVLLKKIRQLQTILAQDTDRLEKYSSAADNIKTADREDAKKIRQLQKELANCPIQDNLHRKTLRKKIKELQEQIEIRKEYMIHIKKMYGISSKQDYRAAKDNYAHNYRACSSLREVEQQLQTDTDKFVKEYHAELSTISSDQKSAINEERKKVRTQSENVTKKLLQKKYGTSFNISEYETALQQTDKLLESVQNKEPNNKRIKSADKKRHP